MKKIDFLKFQNPCNPLKAKKGAELICGLNRRVLKTFNTFEFFFHLFSLKNNTIVSTSSSCSA